MAFSSHFVFNYYVVTSSRSLGQSSAASATPTSTPPPLRRSPLDRRNALAAVDKKLTLSQDLKVHFLSIQQEKVRELDREGVWLMSFPW